MYPHASLGIHVPLGVTCIPRGTCIPGVHVCPRDTSIPRIYVSPGIHVFPGDTCIPGIHVSQGYRGIHGQGNMTNLSFRYPTLFRKVTICHYLKTSTSRNNAHRVLHSRFSPSGFVLKPVRLIHMFLRKLWRFS